METELGIGQFVKDSYKIYGREVNLNRHIPYLYDGLKPSSQRLIYTALGYKDLIKTATLIGETMGKYHPHGDASLRGTVTSLVRNLGIFEGQGNFGYSFLTGETCEEADPRYTEVEMKSGIKSQLLKLIDFVPKVTSEIGYPIAMYIPTPVPFALVSGDIGISIGINQRIPAFSAKSLVSAYRADDPMKLESQYGLQLIKNQDQLTSLWKTGCARLHLKMKTTRDSEGITIEGNSNIFTPDLAYMFQEFKWGNVDFQDLSAETSKIRFSKAYRVRKITVEDVQRFVENASNYLCSYYIRINDGNVAQPIGMRDWIHICYNNYAKLATTGSQAEIKKLEDKIVFYSNIKDVYAQLVTTNKSKADLASEKNIPISVVNKISSKSVDYIRDCIPEKSIKECESKIKELKNGNISRMIDAYVEELK